MRLLLLTKGLMMFTLFNNANTYFFDAFQELLRVTYKLVVL